MTPTEVRQLLVELDLRPSKALGQNFLIDGNILDILMHEADVRSNETVIEIDDIVMALTNVSNDSIARELQAKGMQVKTIGDCIASRHAAAALYDGRRAGMEA